MKNEIDAGKILFQKPGQILLDKECNTWEITGKTKGGLNMIVFLLLYACEKDTIFRSALLLVAKELNNPNK